jgi:hypothetical protein
MLLLTFVPALILSVIMLVCDEQTRKSIPKGVLVITVGNRLSDADAFVDCILQVVVVQQYCLELGNSQ